MKKITLNEVLSLARQAAPTSGADVAFQVGRLVSAKAMSPDNGIAFLVDAGVPPTTIGKAIHAASKKPAGPNAVGIALRKLIGPVSTLRGRKAPSAPRDIDLFGKVIPRKNTSEKEESIQARLVDHLTKFGRPDIYWFHPANGGYRSIRTATRLKAQGVRAGVPDLVFLIDGRAHFLELKREVGGSVSAVQKIARMEILAAGGVHAVARGYDDAMAILNSWGVFSIRVHVIPSGRRNHAA